MPFVAALFAQELGATASKVVKEKMDDGSGTGAEQERRREGRAARQSGEKFETVPKLRGAQRRRGTSWRREGRPPTAKGIFHRPPGWWSFKMRPLFVSSPGSREILMVFRFICDT